MRVVTVLSVLVITVYSSMINKKVHFDKFGNCPEYHNYTTFIRNVKLTDVNDHQFVDYDMHVVKDTRGILAMTIDITRCAKENELESCEKFKSIKTNQLCSFTGMSPWYTPRLRCPLKRGIYRARNGTFDGLTFIPMTGNFQFKVKVFDLREKIVACFAGSYKTIDL